MKDKRQEPMKYLNYCIGMGPRGASSDHTEELIYT